MKTVFSKKESGHYDLLTESGEQFLESKQLPWQKYPRPQMKRVHYQLLNGEWELNGKMTVVPFPPQSMLSGYHEKIDDKLVYLKTFVPNSDLSSVFKEDASCAEKGRILLHFGAVDQVAEVWLNDIFIGKHEGGYLPFYFDVTDALKEGENRLRVEATDTLSHDYPYGKQKKDRGGMWYTPVSGIWQTVWMERVPSYYIERIKLIPDLTGVSIEVYTNKKESENKGTDGNGFTAVVTLDNGVKIERNFENLQGRVTLCDVATEDGSPYVPKCWTPEEPYLYDMKIRMNGDEVDTYFALRTINIEETGSGKRVCLNGKPVFLHGVLDQGYFSDGIYLPAREEEFENDIMRMKELGINMLRKHIKIEPEAFYYACDRLGMLVMQDMVNSGPYSFIGDTALPTVGFKKRRDSFGKASSIRNLKSDLSNLFLVKDKRKAFFIWHTRETMEHLHNHPSIIAYTIFNEGWGQFCSDAVYDLMKKWEPARLIDSTSGWFSQKKNDFDSEHIYFKVISLKVKDRPLFVSECGGYSMLVSGHHYSKDKEYGYGACKDSRELTDKIVHMYENMILPSVKDGLCGCVYTQLSDVEEEINGLYTYDRKICKVEKERMQRLAGALVDKLME